MNHRAILLLAVILIALASYLLFKTDPYAEMNTDRADLGSSHSDEYNKDNSRPVTTESPLTKKQTP